MTNPNTTVRSRPTLAGSLIEFPLAAAGIGAIAYQACPVIEVPTQSGEYGNISAKEILTPGHRKRSPKSGYQRSEFEFSDRTWSTSEYGGEGVIDDRRAAQFKDYFDAEKSTAEIERFKNMQAAEKRVADMIMNTSNFAGQVTNVTTAWSDHGSSDPIADVHEGRVNIRSRSGLLPQIGLASWAAFENLKRNHKIIARVQAEGAGGEANVSKLTAEKIAEILGLDKLFIGGMVENTANINQSMNIADVWDTDLFALAYIDETGNIEMPTALRCFHWSDDGSQIGGVIESYRDESVRGDIIRVRHDVDEQIVMSELVELIAGIE